ncbi:MAG: hypothetical protein NZO16_05430 [Deltaproteobacteria bacterium]|nr:hypothetical protein [Deltaproteobacteria bacterium]
MALLELTIDNIRFLGEILDALEERKASYAVINESYSNHQFKVQVLKCSSIEDLKKKYCEYSNKP